jgi:retinol dehydrogenase 14
MNETLLGRTCVVTGATGGIGLEVARGLACRGATVVMACRDRTRAEAARLDVLRSTGNERLEIAELDLSLASSIRTFASTLAKTHAKVDVLVNNAATWPERRELTAEGVERTWATNVLGPFLLTDLLLGPLGAAGAGLVVNVASITAGFLDLSDPEFTRRRFVPAIAYVQSKQAMRMWTWELAQRLGSGTVRVHAMHPGAVGTGLFDRHRGPVGSFMSWGIKLVGRTPEAGADTVVWLCTAPPEASGSGKFWADRRLRRCRFAQHREGARLWELCERACALPG